MKVGANIYDTRSAAVFYKGATPKTHFRDK